MRAQPTHYDRAAVASILDEPLPAGTKGIPLESAGMSVGELARGGLHALGGDLPMPLLVLRQSALVENIEAMAAFCARNGVLLAPHGKTSMAPQLLARQIDAGAWAITAATPAHARVYRRFGVQRIFYANQLVEDRSVAWVCEELRRDPGFELFCLVDSIAGVRRLDASLAAHDAPRPLPVLVEVGYPGGRAGVRDGESATAVAAAASAAARLELVGLECFEGLIAGDDLAHTVQRVDDWLDQVALVADQLIEARHLPDEPLLSAGGSAFFDRVVARLGEVPGRLVLRSGCYVTHDGGFYAETSPMAGRADGQPSLREALELWSSVLSRPEPQRAIAGFGKRDAPYDLGLPAPRWRRAQNGSQVALDGATVVTLNDQHAAVELPAATDLEVGDLLGCSISHPCGAFDRWRVIPALDDDGVVVDAIATFF